MIGLPACTGSHVHSARKLSQGSLLDATPQIAQNLVWQERRARIMSHAHVGPSPDRSPRPRRRPPPRLALARSGHPSPVKTKRALPMLAARMCFQSQKCLERSVRPQCHWLKRPLVLTVGPADPFQSARARHGHSVRVCLRRLAVLPGLVGLAQVLARPNAGGWPAVLSRP